MSSPMTLRCRACGWSWGPVGVRPAVPGGPAQLFLACSACAKPQSRTVEPGHDPASLTCTACGAGALRPLNRCPGCDSDSLSWGPFMPM